MSNLTPHVLIFPYPMQGHINSMLNLAQMLSLSGLNITFLLTDHTYSKLMKNSTVFSRVAKYPGFCFQKISDGLTDEQASLSGNRAFEVFHSMKPKIKSNLKDLLVSNCLFSGDRGPVTNIIADGILGFVLEVGEELGIPAFTFRTSSACDFWADFCVPQLIDAAELPFKGSSCTWKREQSKTRAQTYGTNLDVLIENIPSMDGFLRRRDLPHFFRAKELGEIFQSLVADTRLSTRAHGIILNTFQDLEGPIISEIRVHCPKLYVIGPITAHLKSRLGDESTCVSNSLLEEDRSSLNWLDTQPSGSVIYVSLGSVVMMTWAQLLEFWYGLLNSGQKFLWARRRNIVKDGDGESHIPAELLEGTTERGYIVDWAPQQEVLAHKAVGGFLTHCGWNSLNESIMAGVPMICWPYVADQLINSRFVEKIWKLGLDMKDAWDRKTVEKMVRSLMVLQKDEFKCTTDRMAHMAKVAINEGGSSYCDLDSLIEEIRSIAKKPST